MRPLLHLSILIPLTATISFPAVSHLPDASDLDETVATATFLFKDGHSGNAQSSGNPNDTSASRPKAPYKFGQLGIVYDGYTLSVSDSKIISDKSYLTSIFDKEGKSIYNDMLSGQELQEGIDIGLHPYLKLQLSSDNGNLLFTEIINFK